MATLVEILEHFQDRVKYRDLDKTALNISRKAAAGNLGEGDYAEWALINNDPLVVVNYVKTYITTLVSKLSSSPCRPEDNDLFQTGMNLRLDAIFNITYKAVFDDGYDYLGVGIKDGVPQVRRIDARYILFNGDEATLRDATEVVVFEIVPMTRDEAYARKHTSFPTGYVEFNTESERVITTHYYKDTDGTFKMAVYDDYEAEPTVYPLTGLDRIPIVRFVGDAIELDDQKYHYRGLYYTLGSVLKALTLTATKIQIRTANSEDNNWVVSGQAIANFKEDWKNSGARAIDTVDGNGIKIDTPITPITHDNQFLIQAFENWKGVIADMLGPVVQSGSEAVTREEVLARNEVRDALANTYLSRLVDSISEVYRCIQMFMGRGNQKVVILGGFIEAAKKSKYKSELLQVYNIAKEAGLNVQGIAKQVLAMSELPDEVRTQILATFEQDPYASPLVVQLKGNIQQLEQQAYTYQQQIGILKSQLAQRAEYRAEYVAMQERTKRAELALQQWKEEQKNTQQARMEFLKKTLEAGDTQAALILLQQIEEQDPLITSTPVVENDMHKGDEIYQQMTQPTPIVQNPGRQEGQDGNIANS